MVDIKTKAAIGLTAVLALGIGGGVTYAAVDSGQPDTLNVQTVGAETDQPAEQPSPATSPATSPTVEPVQSPSDAPTAAPVESEAPTTEATVSEPTTTESSAPATDTTVGGTTADAPAPQETTSAGHPLPQPKPMDPNMKRSWTDPGHPPADAQG